MLPFPTNPSTLLAQVQKAARWSVGTVEIVAGLPVRAAALLDEIDGLMQRVSGAVDQVEGLMQRVSGAVDQVEGLVQHVSGVVDDATRAVAAADAVIAACAVLVDRTAVVASETEIVVGSASRSAAVADELLTLYRPLALQAAPVATRFVDELGEEEVHAAIALVDQLPELTERMTALMPILATLDTVSPEIHELLEVVKDVRQAILGVPGFAFFRRRGEVKLGEPGESE